MQEAWIRIRAYWHIGTTIFIVLISAIYWVHDQSGLVPRVEALETLSAEHTTTLAVIGNQVNETHDQVKQIWQAMRLDKSKK